MFDYNKLLEYGFVLDNGTYHYSKYIMNNDFVINIFIDGFNNIDSKVIDVNTWFDYINYKIYDISGSFVNEIRNYVKDTIDDIKCKCMVLNQKDRLLLYVKNKYGICEEYLWENDKNSCVFRKNDNKKWFGIVMRVRGTKFGFDLDNDVFIINVKTKDINIIDNNCIFAAYHMNKKNWVSIVLDDKIDDDILFRYVDESFSLVL